MQKALIVWGGWEGHEPQACARIVEDILIGLGFEVRVEEGVQALGETDLSDLSLLVPIVTMGKMSREMGQTVSKAIASGVGLAGFHGGIGDSFRDCSEFQYIVGGQFVAHPGNVITYDVNITRPDDPVMQGISDFTYTSEQYYLHVDPAIEVLATTTFSGAHDPWTAGTVMPVAWKKRFGAGRVFYSALGHKAAEFDHPQMRRLFTQGAAWAAR
ncbi:Trehalose utilization [Aquimixticola soesokkakensis]|uniref:Trehalose utilization n=1 Tax=Aquimixticola soesokkakensis TaxID=1519096 RepID=A0A1Y5RVV8_9RHOB|nr:ThuA domain-containing protein [Aquimixticola soesokkakensis]SLN26265.1 Trehalose utilization [Aquimixticola soesokkakensis]